MTIGDAGSQSAPISHWAAARTASRQILRGWATPPSRTPLQLPILVCDVRDAGLYRVVGTLVHALRDPIEHKLPLVRVPVLVARGSREPIVPQRGQRRPPGSSRWVSWRLFGIGITKTHALEALVIAGFAAACRCAMWRPRSPRRWAWRPR